MNSKGGLTSLFIMQLGGDTELKSKTWYSIVMVYWTKGNSANIKN